MARRKDNRMVSPLILELLEKTGGVKLSGKDGLYPEGSRLLWASDVDPAIAFEFPSQDALIDFIAEYTVRTGREVYLA